MKDSTFPYADGSAVKVGDSVLFEYGQTPGVVEHIVAPSREMADWNVEKPGVMLLSPPFRRIYLPEWSLRADPLQFVADSQST